MSHASANEINFWPAYVDALINVVLNLLFLVGVFTIGLVSLNGQALLAERAAQARQLAALQAASTHEERQQLAKAFLRQTSALDSERSSAASDAAALPPLRVVEIRLHARVPSQPRKEANTSPESTTRLPNETALTGAASSPTDTLAASNPFDAFMDALRQNAPLTRIAFDINQYSLPSDGVWPSFMRTQASEKSWWLFVLSDPANPRLSREAFERLVATRTVLLQAGALPQHIQIQIIPPPDSVTTPPGIERTVWVVERAL